MLKKTIKNDIKNILKKTNFILISIFSVDNKRLAISRLFLLTAILKAVLYIFIFDFIRKIILNFIQNLLFNFIEKLYFNHINDDYEILLFDLNGNFIH